MEGLELQEVHRGEARDESEAAIGIGLGKLTSDFVISLYPTCSGDIKPSMFTCWDRES